MENGNFTHTGLIPWKDGRYMCKGMPVMMIIVKGENVHFEFANDKGTLKHGEFGEASPAVVAATGKKFYNWEMTIYNGHLTIHGVLSDDDKTVTFINRIKELDTYQWVSEEEFAAFKDFGDPVDAPNSHYTPQPENLGKFLIITGPPGLGKSTTGLLLSKMAGYVYYEGDCFIQSANPFLPPSTKEPTLEVYAQKPLIGIPQQRKNAIYGRIKEFTAIIKGEDYDMDPVAAFYCAQCADISKQRKRLGGDWVVALPVAKISWRDFVREKLGPDLVFVVLRMKKEEQKKRITQRHGEPNKFLEKITNVFESVAENEPNAIDIEVTADTTREELVHTILKLIK